MAGEGEEAADAGQADDGVHRLVDMVVEEVSLVDRAANQRRYLLVKRGEDMADDDEGVATGLGGLAAGEAIVAVLTGLVDAVAASEAEKAKKPPPGEGGDAGDDDDDEDEDEDDDEPGEGGEGDAAGKRPPPKPRAKAGRVEALLGEVRAALGRLQAALAAPAQKRAATGDDPRLTALTTSNTALEGVVKKLEARLVTVEGSVGPPASRPTEGPGRGGKDDDDVSWPLDLNEPRDRAHTEKGVSFHDA